MVIHWLVPSFLVSSLNKKLLSFRTCCSKMSIFFLSHLCRSCSWRQHQQHVFTDTRDGGWATEKSSMGPTTQCLVELVFFPWVKRQTTTIIIVIVACSFATSILLKWTSIWKLCALDFEFVYVIGNKTLWTWFQLWQKLKCWLFQRGCASDKWQHNLGVIIPVDSNHLEYFLLDSLHAIVIITVHITFYLMKSGF